VEKKVIKTRAGRNLEAGHNIYGEENAGNFRGKWRLWQSSCAGKMEKECACPAEAAINSGVSATCPSEEMIHLSRPSAPGPRDQDNDHVVQFHVNPGVTVSLQVGDSVRVVKGDYRVILNIFLVVALLVTPAPCGFCRGHGGPVLWRSIFMRHRKRSSHSPTHITAHNFLILSIAGVKLSYRV
jgi:hypothetical protein